MRRLSLIVVALVALLLAAPSSPAATGDQARYILPPGNFGGLPTGPNSLDQLPLYEGLTPLRGNVTQQDFERLYLPENFQPVGATRREETGNPDVTVDYDAYGIPHIKGRTRAGMMFGAGWVMARDRRLLFDFGRNPARAAVADVPGLDAFSLVTSATPFTPSAQAEALVTRQRRTLVRAYGAEGRQMLRDMADYAKGINAFYAAPGGPEPPAKPFDANDVIAVTAFIGSIFGAGGGAEHQNADLLAKLQSSLGARRGRAAWQDAMLSNDPEAPTTTRRRFSYPILTGGPVRGSLVPDAGSVRLVPDPSKPAGGGGASRAAEPRRLMSNWLQVAPSRSATGNSLGVMGPQLGYFYPEIVYQQHLQGPGVNAQGVAASGLGLYMLIGRTQDYGWSLTTATHDNRDVFAERLCEPDGSRPTRASRHYVFRGRCRAMQTIDAGRLGTRELSFQQTVHGPVLGTLTARGRPYALARQRSTYGRDALNLVALKRLTENRATTPSRFYDTANQFGFTFNWAWTARRGTAFFSSGRLPVRARGLDRRLPTLGDGRFEWRGFLGERQHPHDLGGPSGLLLNWNNKAAPGFEHGDDAHYGSLYRNELFDRWPRKVRLLDVVRIMNRAATEDLHGRKLWPLLRAVMSRGTAPDARTARAAEILDDWSRRDAPINDVDGDGRNDDAGEAIMDPAWPRFAEAVMRPVYGARLADLEDLIGRPRGASPGGSSFGGTWPSYVDKDLRTVLRRPVRGRFALRYCGRGSVRACAESLWTALKQTSDELAAAQGDDPAAWRSANPRISFAPGLIPTTMRWTNRPTFQQALELVGPRRR